MHRNEICCTYRHTWNHTMKWFLQTANIYCNWGDSYHDWNNCTSDTLLYISTTLEEWKEKWNIPFQDCFLCSNMSECGDWILCQVLSLQLICSPFECHIMEAFLDIFILAVECTTGHKLANAISEFLGQNMGLMSKTREVRPLIKQCQWQALQMVHRQL